jgi:hypothetical protein
VFEPHVDNFAHAGGLIGGVLIGLLLRPAGIEGRRKTAFRFAGSLLALMAVVSLFHVGRNVEGAGYPRKPPPLVTRQDPNHGWTVQVPNFWITNVEAGRVDYEDPVGAVLSIIPVPDLTVQPERGEKVTTLGKNTYLEEQVVLADGKRRIAQYRCLTVQREGSYLLLFECEAPNKGAYEDLLTRILTSFDVRARPPQKRTPPRLHKTRGTVA